MSRYKKFVCLIVTIEIVLLLLCNILYFRMGAGDTERLYRVEAHRVALQLQEAGTEDPSGIDLSAYKTIVKISEFDPEESCGHDYIVAGTGERLYRIEYEAQRGRDIFGYMNAALLGMMLLTGVVLLYIQRKVLNPFRDISGLPYELAKGNLSMPVKEEKSKLFGRFLWGMDMLRQKLEENREKELKYQKDKKLLILSLSHDIRTPLSSIDLYAQTLSRNLYDTEEKRQEAISGIRRNVKEIKKYVDEIAESSREDFLNLEVIQGEFYLSEIMKKTETYYKDKLSVVHTKLLLKKSVDCLLQGDKDRFIEVIQNVMENAMKYGDGQCITIGSENEEDCRLIHIENSGCSLKEEELPSLFDPFYRGSNSHGVKGNGLGLYICKCLMHKMDGEIFAGVHGKDFRITVVARKA